jgi:hypothetical protein
MQHFNFTVNQQWVEFYLHPDTWRVYLTLEGIAKVLNVPLDTLRTKIVVQKAFATFGVRFKNKDILSTEHVFKLALRYRPCVASVLKEGEFYSVAKLTDPEFYPDLNEPETDSVPEIKEEPKMKALSITNQNEFIQYIKDNSIGDRALSIRGLAALCGVSPQSIVEGAHFKSQKLGQKLTAQGFEAGHLVEQGFNSMATWSVVEYFAYEGKAEALGAKHLAKLFGSLGFQSCFTAAHGEPIKENLKMKLLRIENNDGLEFHVDEATGLAYASVRATERMLNTGDGTIRKFIASQSAEKFPCKTAEILTDAGLRSAELLSAEQVFLLAIKYSPELALKMGAAGANIFMLGMAGYKVQVDLPSTVHGEPMQSEPIPEPIKVSSVKNEYDKIMEAAELAIQRLDDVQNRLREKLDATKSVLPSEGIVQPQALDSVNALERSYSNSGRPGKPVQQYSLNPRRLVAEYSSIKEASESNCISKSNIAACLSKRTRSAGGYDWNYKG